jgi:hypothetical protein
VAGGVGEGDSEAAPQRLHHGRPRSAGLGKAVEKYERLRTGRAGLAYTADREPSRLWLHLAGWRPLSRRWVLCLFVTLYRWVSTCCVPVADHRLILAQ